jgi:hypothetical protein
MSAGSDASNLGYGNMSPFNNSSYVNGTNSNYSGSFSSNEIPGLPGLAGAKNNVDAAAGKVPGICLFKGGAKRLKTKIKNITKRYKMKGGRKSRRSLRRRVKSRAMALAGGRRNHSRSRQMAMARTMAMARSRVGGTRRRNNRKYHMKGGYSQYQNNLPMTPTYQVAGINLPASELGLANPPPIKVLPNCTNCVDNYNHFTGQGFPSRGH